MKKAILAVLAGLAVFMAGAVVASAGSGNTSSEYQFYDTTLGRELQ